MPSTQYRNPDMGKVRGVLSEDVCGKDAAIEPPRIATVVLFGTVAAVEGMPIHASIAAAEVADLPADLPYDFSTCGGKH